MKAADLEESLRHRMSTFLFVEAMAPLDPKQKFKNPTLTPRLMDIIDICDQRDFPPLQTVDALTQVTYKLMPRLYLNGIIVGRRIKDCVRLIQLTRSSIGGLRSIVIGYEILITSTSSADSVGIDVSDPSSLTYPSPVNLYEIPR